MPLPASLIDLLKNYQLQPWPSVTGLPQPITFRSVADFAGALLWAWLLLVNFNGWGRLTGKLFRMQRLPAAVACSLGIATTIFLGGWLNLLHAIYAYVLFALVVIGIVLYFWLRKERPEAYRWLTFWNHASRWSRLLILLALLILILRVAATVRLGMFNHFDDNAAYLVFPHKMLAVHHFAFDPFSNRRVISSLGGSYLLQDFVIAAATSLAHIAMADRTLGLVLLGGILFDLGIACNLSSAQIALLEFLVYLAPAETINLTFVILPLPLLLGMAWAIWETPEENLAKAWKYSLIAGAIGGAAIALKSTYLPIVGAFLVIPYWALLGRKKIKTALLLPFIAGLAALSVLLAWMVAMKLTSGTYLFPVLGHGVDYSSYGILQTKETFHSHRAFLKIFLQAAALLAMAGLQFLTGNRSRRSKFNVGILIAATIAITAFNYRSGGDFIWRYNFPQFFCAVIIFYIVAAGNVGAAPDSARVRLSFYIGAFLLLAMIFYFDASGKNPRLFRQVTLEWHDYKPSLRASLSGLHLANPQVKAEYSAAEDSIPFHQIALENTAYPFLFSYRGHTIFIMDWPGAASPAKAWPLQGNSQSVGQYLVSDSIRYVIYDYGYARWNDVEDCKALESPSLYSKELISLWWMDVLVHNQLDRLRMRYHSIYDDGKIAVIDLHHPLQNTSLEKPRWTLHTDKEQVCSAVMTQYLAGSVATKGE